MKNFWFRLKLFLSGHKEMSFIFLKQLTMTDIGRWFFKKAYTCNRCGSLGVIGYRSDYGLICDVCDKGLDLAKQSCHIAKPEIEIDVEKLKKLIYNLIDTAWIRNLNSESDEDMKESSRRLAKAIAEAKDEIVRVKER